MKVCVVVCEGVCGSVEVCLIVCEGCVVVCEGVYGSE